MILAYLLKQKNLEWAGGHFGGSEQYNWEVLAKGVR